MRKGKKIAGVILAAGRGKRMGKKIPKQYLKINGKEIFLYTFQKFLECDFFDEIIIVVSRDWLDKAPKIIKKFSADKRVKVILGGKTRKDSVYSALHFLKDRQIDYVLFHDAVRPFVNKKLISTIVGAAIKYGAAIAGIKGSDLIAEVKKENISCVIPPQKVVLTQTPECFKFDLIFKIHRFARTKKFLRAATNLELMLNSKEAVKLVFHNERNLKITYPLDIQLAAELLKNKQ